MARQDSRPRPSAATLLRLLLGAALAVPLLAMVVGALVLSSASAARDVLPYVVTAWVVIVIVTVGILPTAFRARRDDELRRGFTTLPRSFLNVDTIDAKSGEVLRHAGQPLMTREQYRAAISEARRRKP